jgi:hypothetical protein
VRLLRKFSSFFAGFLLFPILAFGQAKYETFFVKPTPSGGLAGVSVVEDVVEEEPKDIFSEWAKKTEVERKSMRFFRPDEKGKSRLRYRAGRALAIWLSEILPTVPRARKFALLWVIFMLTFVPGTKGFSVSTWHPNRLRSLVRSLI